MTDFTAADSFQFADVRDGTSNTLGDIEQDNLYSFAVENDDTHWGGRDRFHFRPEVDDEVVVQHWGDPHFKDSDADWPTATDADPGLVF